MRAAVATVGLVTVIVASVPTGPVQALLGVACVQPTGQAQSLALLANRAVVAFAKGQAVQPVAPSG